MHIKGLKQLHGACWLRLEETCTEFCQSDGVHFRDGSISSVCFVEERRGPQAAKAELRLNVSLNTAIRDWAQQQPSERRERHCP